MKTKNPKQPESCQIDVGTLNAYLKENPKALETIAGTFLNRRSFTLYGLNVYESSAQDCVFELISVDGFNRLHTVLILFDQTGELEEMKKLAQKLIREHEKRELIENRELIDIIIVTYDSSDTEKLYLEKKRSKVENKTCQIQILNQLYRGDNKIGKLFLELKQIT